MICGYFPAQSSPGAELSKTLPSKFAPCGALREAGPRAFADESKSGSERTAPTRLRAVFRLSSARPFHSALLPKHLLERGSYCHLNPKLLAGRKARRKSACRDWGIAA